MAKRVVASYCTTFLKPEMLHIYRQVRSLHEFDTFVMTKALQNIERFPFRDIELIPKPRGNPLRHGWLKWVKQQPAILYRGEYQMLSKLLERRGADLMHIYFGHTGVHLLPFIERWHKPCVVSFHGADVAEKKDIRDYGPKLKKLFDAAPSRSRNDCSRSAVRPSVCASIALAFRSTNFLSFAVTRPLMGAGGSCRPAG
jgi:colanic acid/amylovoran biosynthesis glycosyltransferase